MYELLKIICINMLVSYKKFTLNHDMYHTVIALYVSI